MSNFNKKVCVIGLGYIGLPTAAIIASTGVNVVGVDVNVKKVDTVNRGETYFLEPNLDFLVQKTVQSCHLRATTDIESSDVFIIAVPTPVTANNKPDLTDIKAVIRALAPFLKKNDLIILESTVPPGTTDMMISTLAKMRSDLTFPNHFEEDPDIFVCYCPERVLPGNILNELREGHRIIGGTNAMSSQKAIELYSLFSNGDLSTTDSRTAEMTKLVENSFRDINIAFANELSMLCEDLGVNTQETIRLANKHPRVKILEPGPGVGGHCIAVDPWFLVNASQKNSKLIQTARKVNDRKADYIAKKIIKKSSSLKKPIIACFGLSYKKDVCDTRLSPAIKIIARVAKKRSNRILIIEPHLKKIPSQLAGLENIEMVGIKEALKSAHILVILVGHKQFHEINWAKFDKESIIDTVGIIAIT